MAKFPDFIIIGSMKCGTTVLWRNLDKHPEISMGKNWDDPKKTSTEIRFWNNQGPHHTWAKKGIDWYKTLFSGDCCGEKSANYIESEEAFKRMKTHISDVKLVLCVRNPVDRAYSEYVMQRSTAPQKHTRGFKIASHDKGYRKRGKYFKMLKNNVLPHFSKDQIYIVVQERMYADTEAEVNKLCDFLGVGHAFLSVKRVKFKERDKNTDQYRKWKTEYNNMPSKVRKELSEYYKKNNNNLFEFMGYEVREWLNESI